MTFARFVVNKYNVKIKTYLSYVRFKFKKPELKSLNVNHYESRPRLTTKSRINRNKINSNSKYFLFASSVLYWNVDIPDASAPDKQFGLVASHPAFQKSSVLRTLVEFISTIIRGLKLFILLSPLIFTYPIIIYFPQYQEWWYRFLLQEIELCGAIFVKLGQWASTRHDLFPLRLCERLSKLQHHTSPHLWKFTQQRLEENYGFSWQEIFIQFDQKPIGSGCIAQVYKAWVNSNTFDAEQPNRIVPVAVKVLHPGIENLFRQDLAIMKFGSKLLSTLFPSLKWLNLPACVEEFAQVMMAQVDMQIEADNLRAFTKNFSHHKNVVFPKPVDVLTRSDILVESFESGVSIANYVVSGTDTSDPDLVRTKKSLANLGVHVLLKMVFIDNFVHGDLHPGNVLIRKKEHPEPELVDWDPFSAFSNLMLSDEIFYPTQKRPSKGEESDLELVIIDCGIVAFLRRKELEEKFRDTFRAIVLGEGEKVADLFLQTSYHQCKDTERFRKGMADIIQQAREQTITLAKIDVSLLLQQVFELLTSNQVRLESEFSSLLVALMVLEGLGRSLDPTLNLLEEARPYLLQKML